MTISSIRMLQAAILLSTSLTTFAIPMTYKLAKHEEQCLYDTFEDQDHATIAVSILTGSKLAATAKFSGPLCANDSSVTGAILQAAGIVYDPAYRQHDQTYAEFSIDLESMYDGHDDDDYEDDDELLHDDNVDFDDDEMDDVTFQEYYYDMDDDDDEEYMFMEDDMMTPDEINEIRARKEAHGKMTPEERVKANEERKQRHRAETKERFDKRKEKKAKRDAKKQRLMEKKKKRHMTQEEMMHEGMMSGKAHESTYQVRKAGWYRVCIEANHNSITAEIEMRKTGDVGPINKKTGHLSTYEHHEMMQREKRMSNNERLENQKQWEEEVEKAKLAGNANLPIPDAIREEDLKTSRHQIATLHRLLNEIREKQQDERHRILQHTTVNQHSHSRMVLSSLFETVFYIAVSGFQVYTIRKWFRGNPILGY